MAVRARHTTPGNRRDGSRKPIARTTTVAPGTGLASERVGEALGQWQRSELRIARGFGECKGLSSQELEDIYQDTVEVLLGRTYTDELHLRNALRGGLKHRALHFHRDEGRRQEIRSENNATLGISEQTGQDSTEREALIREDRLLVAEFLTELSPIEQRVFSLMAEGMKYRLIAKVLDIETTTARNTSRSCERKREHFQLLYDTGRLCGYRAVTINALQAGQSTSEDLARRAIAHVEGCAHCRAEHQTNAKRLRARFEGQAAILLPLPAFMHRLGRLARLGQKARMLQHRHLPNGLPGASSGVRESARTLLTGTGAAGKLAVGLATLTVVAGGTIGATHALEEHKPAPHHHTIVPVSEPSHLLTAQPLTTPLESNPIVQRHRHAARSRRRHKARPHARASAVRSASSGTVARATRHTVEGYPGEFAYLSAPNEVKATSTPPPANTASAGSEGEFAP